MKHKLLVAALPVAIALASASASADAGTKFSYSGIGCQSAVGAQSSCLDRTQYGTHNTCGFDVILECPVDTSFVMGTATAFGMQAYDRNSSTDVNCDLQQVDASGNISFTANIKTSASGAGVMSPFLGSLGPLLGGAWRLRCTLPAVTGGGFSHLVSYMLNNNQS
jgi:hypothetical protein